MIQVCQRNIGSNNKVSSLIEHYYMMISFIDFMVDSDMLKDTGWLCVSLQVDTEKSFFRQIFVQHPEVSHGSDVSLYYLSC